MITHNEFIQILLPHIDDKHTIYTLLNPDPNLGEVSSATYYQKTYPIILKNVRTALTDGDFETAIIQATIGAGAWVAGIPNTTFPQESINCIQENFNDLFRNEITISQTQECNYNSRIFTLVIDNITYNLQQLFFHINCLINSGNVQYMMPTSSKVAHFLNPHLFPIYDSRLATRLEATDSFINYKKYYDLIYQTKNNNEIWNTLITRARENHVSPVRIIDSILFNN